MNNRDTHRYIRTVLSESNQKLILKELKKSKHFKNIDRFNENIVESRNRKILKEDVDKVVADLAVENNLPAESEPILRNHILTLMSAAVPAFIPNPVSAYLVLSNVMKGNYVEAFKNLPPINIFLVPEALYEVIMSGLAALPSSLREDIIQNRYVKDLLRLLLSLKEVQKSEDIDSFYMNLKDLISASGHALVAFSAFLAGLAAVCASIGQFEGLITIISSAILTLTGGAAFPVLLTIASGIAAFCGTLIAAAAGTGFVGFLINVVAKVDPNKIDLKNKKLQSDLDKFSKKMAARHKEEFDLKMRKTKLAQKQIAGPTSRPESSSPIPPEAAPPAPTQLALTDQSTRVPDIIDTELGPDGVYAAISESKINLKLWHRIAGL